MIQRWFPALILVLGAVLTLGAAQQEALPLRQPLGEVVPPEVLGYHGTDLGIAEDEAQVAGFSNYLFRVYERPLATADSTEAPADAPPPWFSLYVGYYELQARGQTIHSPKNCLPGAGWEPLSSEPATVQLGEEAVIVNRYILQNGPEQALVLYWYQGRGRIAHDEYRVKLDLLRDAALRRRSDEALVRIVVPVTEGDVGGALELATGAAKRVIPTLDLALPVG
jgi:EpsI family protein